MDESSSLVSWGGVGSDELSKALGGGGGVSEEAADENFSLRLRPARRSFLSLGAPVAKRTRSGSTWNMSPGLSW